MVLDKSRIITTLAVITAAITLMALQLSRFALDASLSHWHSGAEGYQNALALHNTTRQPIALFFHTDGCASCKKLRETVLATPEFTHYLKNVIPVKINPESGLKERQIADNYGVEGYPVFLLADINREKVVPVRTSQSLSPQEFIELCKAAQQKFGI
ncbi:MAG TPA: thioredoxin family protein [Gammaproteobacteria bacterium]